MVDYVEVLADTNIKSCYQAIKSKNIQNLKELRKFFDFLFKDKSKNVSFKVLELLDFLLDQENPFSNISNTEYVNIVCYSKIRCLYNLTTKNEEEYYKILSNIEKDNILYISALIIIGTHYTKTSQWGKAFKTYNEAEDLLPKFEDNNNLNNTKMMIYGNLAIVYSGAGQFENAEYYFNKSSKYIKDNDINGYLIITLNKLKARKKTGKISSSKYLKAIEKIEKQNKTKHPPIIRYIAIDRSECYINDKDYKKALQIIMAYTKDNPLKNEVIIINLLVCFYNLKRYAEYEELYKKEIERLIVHDKFVPRDNIIENAIEIAKKNNDKEWEVECLYHKVDFDSIYYQNSKQFLLEMEQSKHQLKINAKELEYEKLKAKDQLKYNQELIKKNKELENFASIVAHDIKSPLRSVVSLLDILESSLDLNKKEIEIFNYIKDSNKKLDKFVNDLMNYAKYGKSVDKYCYVDLNKTFKEIQFLLKETIAQNNVTINIKSKLPKLYAYDSACTQLFLNLINNSIKFQKPDSLPKIDIWHEIKSEKTCIYLKDNGIGIQKEDLSKIFQPFKRGRTNVKIDGIGIGLATCQKIIDNIKARISVDSQINQGSTFKIEIAKSLTNA